MPITKKLHYAWLIFIGCCFVNAAAMSASISIVGVYLLPVSSAIGVGPGDWMTWMTVSSVVSFAATSVWGRLIQTRSVNVVTTASTLLLAGGIFAFSFGNSMRWFWAWAVIYGAGLPCIATLTVPTLLGNWFAPAVRGKVLGIASAFIGVGVFCWAPLFTMILQNLGWAMTYRINALIMLVFLLPWTLFVFKFKPEDKGLTQYGEDASADEESAMLQGLSQKKALRTAAFWAMLVIILFSSVGMGFNSNQVGIAVETMAGVMNLENASVLGAAMISAAALGNICGKISFGFLQGKLGLRRTFILFLAMFFAGFALWMIAPVAAVLLVGSFLFGTHNALVSVGYPLAVRMLYGNRDYAKIYANLMSVNGLMGGLSGTIVSFVYQLFGSYAATLVGGMCLVAIVGALLMFVCSRIGKIAWDHPEAAGEQVRAHS